MKRKHLDGETRKSKRPEAAAKLKSKKSKVHESVQGAETETVKSPELEHKKRDKSEKRSTKKKASKSIEAPQTDKTDKPREAKLKKVKTTETTAPAVQEDTEDGEQQRRALQREIQQLVMRLLLFERIERGSI